VAWLPLLLVLAAAPGSGGVVIVTAPPPLDAARLAETLRTYLDDAAVEVRVAPPAPAGELRAELAGLRATGVDLRAIAAVHVSRTGPRTLELQLVDLVTDKTLVTAVPPTAREADLYRVLALKIHGLLRSALYEAVATSSATPAVERIVAVPAPAETRPRALRWDTAYALVSFPLDGAYLQGVLVRGSWSPRRWFALAVGGRALAPLRRDREGVSISLARIPVSLSADLRAEGRRFGCGVGLVTELAAERLSARSEDATVRSRTLLVPAAGLEADAQLRLAGTVALFVRGAALGVLSAERYTVRGNPVVDTSRWLVAIDAGLSFAVW
jgi:hypothetical protein